jgi:arginase family enzyme
VPAEAKQLAASGIGDRDGELVLADIDRHHDRRGRNWGSMNNHGTHLRGCRKTTAQQRRIFESRNLTVPSKHLRRCP